MRNWQVKWTNYSSNVGGLSFWGSHVFLYSYVYLYSCTDLI